MSIIVFILIVSVLVLIHELGHFIAAKLNKVKVEEFGLGYPPRLLSLFKWKETLFSLNTIPFGGFVRLEGEEAPAKEQKSQVQKKGQNSKQASEPFYQKSAKSRLVVILAGAAVNFVFGIIAFSIIFSATGIPTSLGNQSRIYQVLPDSPAATASIPINVNVTGFKDETGFIRAEKIDDVQSYVTDHLGENVTILTSGSCTDLGCEDTTQEFNVYLRTKEETPAGQGSLGLVFTDVIYKFYPWYEMIIRGSMLGLQQAVSMGIVMSKSLGEMIIGLFAGGGLPEEVAGPIGIVHYTQQSQLFAEGFLTILSFAGMLSINLAIVNVLPIPALDGGRALFILLEKIFNKKKVQKVEGYANYAGFILLMGLIVLVSIRDVWRIIVS